MFAVISCTAIPDHVRGFLTRFFSEVSTGLYVGIVSPVVLELFDMDGLLLTSRVPQDDEPELDEEDTEDAA